VDHVARYLVEGGSTISVDAVEGADFGLVRFYLLGAALVSLLFQRKEVPFHAAAVIKHDSAIAFFGFSMAGKSTLCGLLAQRGWRVLTDDRLLIKKDTGKFLAFPSVPVLNLTAASADFIGMGEEKLLRSTANFNKRIYTGLEKYSSGPARLSTLVFLEWDGEETRLDPMDPFEALTCLREQVNYESHLRLLEREDDFFKKAASLALTVPAFRLRRPKSFDALPRTVDAIATIHRASASYPT